MIAGSLPGVLALLWLNHALYGSVIGSGYGAASSLFAVGHINENLSNYSRAIFQTQNVVPLIGLLAPFVFDGIKRKGACSLLAFAGGRVRDLPAVFAISRVVVLALSHSRDRRCC